MRRKALIIGVLPSPFEGPWVSLGGRAWRCKPEVDYLEKVVIDVRTDGSTTRLPLRGLAEVMFTGDSARAVILEDLDLEQVTVNIYV